MSERTCSNLRVQTQCFPPQVLADVGDSQDLAQNLSTFSGHLHRLKRITQAVDASSLVLLDEVTLTTPLYTGLLATDVDLCKVFRWPFQGFQHDQGGSSWKLHQYCEGRSTMQAEA